MPRCPASTVASASLTEPQAQPQALTRRHLRHVVGWLSLLAGSAALAHPGLDGVLTHQHGSLLQGLLHPVLGLDHLLAMVGIGVWAGLGATHSRALTMRAPLLILNGLLAGAMLGLLGLSVPSIEPWLSASVLLLGLLVAERRAHPGLALGLVACFTVVHGLAHGTELSASTNAFEALGGMLVSSLLLLGVGSLAGWRLRHASPGLVRNTGLALAGAGGALMWSVM